MDANGVPKMDRSLKHPRCVFQILKKHYSRYNTALVSKISGTPEADLLEIYKTYSATGARGKAGTIMYAMGWTQHTVGTQNIRCMAIIQLLLGNMGVAGGGVNALRGPDKAVVVVTHYQRLLNYIKPDYVHVLAHGQIIASGGKELALELEEKGYGWIAGEAAA